MARSAEREGKDMTKEKVIEALEDLAKSEDEQQKKLAGNQHPNALADYHRSQGRERALGIALDYVKLIEP